VQTKACDAENVNDVAVAAKQQGVKILYFENFGQRQDVRQHRVMTIKTIKRRGDETMSSEDGRQEGTVKFFNMNKGFGFIVPDKGERDIFVHISAVEQSGLPMLDEGMRVSFETEADRRGKGDKAVNIQMVE